MADLPFDPSKTAFVVLGRVGSSSDEKDSFQPACDSPMVPPGAKRPADWSDLVAEIAPVGDHVVTKRQWGAFYGTDLDLQLRRRGLTTIVLCGIATCFGVESTARDVHERGFDQIFAEDAMSSRSAAEHEHTLTRILPRLGRVRRGVGSVPKRDIRSYIATCSGASLDIRSCISDRSA